MKTYPYQATLVRRILAIVLIALLALPLSAAYAEKEQAKLPAVGEIIEGFEVKSVAGSVKAGAVTLEHKKTGAQVLYMANEDPNRVFDISFRTPAKDDTGLPHVFEHATLGGSEKYPSKSLMFNLAYQTYNTFMNAMTFDVMTTYPVASLSEVQLLRYADFYTDSVLHPLVLTDKSIFDSEAWRYALAKPDGELTITGNVYSEMLGSHNLQSAAQLNAYKTLFPGSAIANSFGGVPEKIPDLKWDDLKEYHKQYYHPSNSLTSLYGDFEDYKAFLKLLDQYFSGYEKKAFDWDDENYAPISAAQTATFEYGVEAGSDTRNGASAFYGIILTDMTDAEGEALSTLAELFAHDASAWKQALKKALPHAARDCYIENGGPEPALNFSASGINAGDAETFRETVDEALKHIEENGFDRQIAEASFAASRINARLATESRTPGVDLIANIARVWATSGEIYAQDYFDTTAPAEGKLDNDGIKAVVAKRLRGAVRTALTVTVPVAGLKEKQDQALREKLAEVKAKLSQEEISALVAQSGRDEEMADDSSEYVRKLRAVTVEELPEALRAYEIDDRTGEDGVRRMDVKANVGEVGQAMLLLSAQSLAREDLHWLKLYADLIGRLDTRSLAHEAVATRMTRYMTRGSVGTTLLGDSDGKGVTPYLQATWFANPADMPESYALLEALLFETKLDDAQAILSAVDAARAAFRQSASEDPSRLLLSRALASADECHAVDEFMNGLAYYAFLENARTLLKDKPEEALSRLKAVQAFVNNRAGAVSTFAGSDEGFARHRQAADQLLAKLGEHKRERVQYPLPTEGKSEGIVIDSAVQYNMLYADYKALGLPGYSGELDAVTALTTDAILYPILRGAYGAYGVSHFGNEQGMFIVSEQDPNVRETFEVYKMLARILPSVPVDQEALNGYILSVYAGYGVPEGELAGAMSAVFDRLEGRSAEQKLARLRELKELTVEKLERFAEVYQKLSENGRVWTAGGAAAIRENAGLYDVVLNPFGSEAAKK